MNEQATPGAAPAAAGMGHNLPPEPTIELSAETLTGILTNRSAKLSTRRDDLVAALARFEDRLGKDGITDTDALGKAGDFDRQLREAEQEIDTQRTALKAPVLAASRLIDGFYRGLSEPIARARIVVQGAMSSYVARTQREAADRARAEAAELARKAEQAANRGDVDTAIALDERAEEVAAAAPAPVRASSDLGTTVFSRQGPWRVRITDATKIPREYLMPNGVKLLAEAKTNKAIGEGQQPIAGVEFYREQKVGTR